MFKKTNSQQRLDSTLVVSNIRTRGRLDLFSNTITVFIRSLDKNRFLKIPKYIRQWHEREPEGWFGLASGQHKAKLEQLAQYVNRLIAIFDGDICRKCSVLDNCPVRAPNHRARGCNPRDTVGNFRLEITPELRLRDQMYSN